VEWAPAPDEHKVISGSVRLSKLLKYGEKFELGIPSLAASRPETRIRFLGIEEMR
jgi:hypothetical protein